MDEVLLIAGMTLVTFLPRWGVLALVGRIALPPTAERALRYVPPAVLAAIVAPGLLLDGEGRLWLAPENSFLVAGIAAGLVAWRTRKLLPTILIGMAVLLAWRAVLGSV